MLDLLWAKKRREAYDTGVCETFPEVYDAHRKAREGLVAKPVKLVCAGPVKYSPDRRPPPALLLHQPARPERGSLPPLGEVQEPRRGGTDRVEAAVGMSCVPFSFVSSFP